MRKAGLENVDPDTATVDIPKRLIPEAKIRKKEQTPEDKLIGKCISVYWPQYKRFYPGLVVSFDNDRKEHIVRYEDVKPPEDPDIFEKLVGKGKVRFKLI
jgi:hypothetical protein